MGVPTTRVPLRIAAARTFGPNLTDPVRGHGALCLPAPLRRRTLLASYLSDVCSFIAHGQHRTGRTAHYRFGHATHKEPLGTFAPMRAHHNKVRLQCGRHAASRHWPMRA